MDKVVRAERTVKDMKFLQFWKMLDCTSPLWINDGEICEYFSDKLDKGICAYADREIEYITHDGEGVLTIELAEEKGESK